MRPTLLLLHLLCALLGVSRAAVERPRFGPATLHAMGDLGAKVRAGGEGEGWEADQARAAAADPVGVIEDSLMLEEALEGAGKELVVVDFYADWCKPCKAIAPLLHSLAAQRSCRGKVRFYKVNVDECRELATEYEVSSMPTILFYSRGKLVHKIVGADLNGLKARVAAATAPPLLRLLRSPAMIVGALGAYLLVPWQRLLEKQRPPVYEW